MGADPYIPYHPISFRSLVTERLMTYSDFLLVDITGPGVGLI